jgi:hypothetical protein
LLAITVEAAVNRACLCTSAAAAFKRSSNFIAMRRRASA